MRLLHPFMPLLTEDIWQQLPKPAGAPQSLMITLYPARDLRGVDDASEASMALVQKSVVALRTIRAEKNIPSSARITAILTVGDDYKKTILDGYQQLIAEQGKCGTVRVRRSGSGTVPPHLQGPSATSMAGGVEVVVPLEGLVDRSAELAKLKKDRESRIADRAYQKRKLDNPRIVATAKPEAVEKDRATLIELEQAVLHLAAAIERLAAAPG